LLCLSTTLDAMNEEEQKKLNKKHTAFQRSYRWLIGDLLFEAEKKFTPTEFQEFKALIQQLPSLPKNVKQCAGLVAATYPPEYCAEEVSGHPMEVNDEGEFRASTLQDCFVGELGTPGGGAAAVTKLIGMLDIFPFCLPVEEGNGNPFNLPRFKELLETEKHMINFQACVLLLVIWLKSVGAPLYFLLVAGRPARWGLRGLVLADQGVVMVNMHHPQVWAQKKLQDIHLNEEYQTLFERESDDAGTLFKACVLGLDPSVTTWAAPHQTRPHLRGSESYHSQPPRC